MYVFYRHMILDKLLISVLTNTEGTNIWSWAGQIRHDTAMLMYSLHLICLVMDKWFPLALLCEIFKYFEVIPRFQINRFKGMVNANGKK